MTYDFDPDKVIRYGLETDSILVKEADGELVYSKDYDQLLAIYHNQQEFIETYAKPAIDREYGKLPGEVKEIAEAAYQYLGMKYDA